MNDIADTLFIGVHPYHPDYESNSLYVYNRNHRILTPNLRQILILDENIVRKTRDALRLNNNYWENKIFVTSDSLGFRGCDDEKIAMQLKMEFSAAKYVFWGAELLMNDGDIRGGCVYHLFYRLNLPNKSIDREYCFIKKI